MAEKKPAKMTMRLTRSIALVLIDLTVSAAGAGTVPFRTTDALGREVRHAATGHVSNYDESKVGACTLPDPLVLANGRPVKDAATWFGLRRPELLGFYETEIYGSVPPNVPKVTFEIADPGSKTLNGSAVLKQIVMHVGGPSGPAVRVHLWLPAKATSPLPLLLHLTFGDVSTEIATATAAVPSHPGEAGPIAEILARGYAYATVRYTEIQADAAGGDGILKLSPAQTPGQWGSISAWAWGLGRVLDYFETDPAVDAKRITVIGHSRLGKTVLWMGARDARVAMVFSSCAGEMGSSLARRDYGESVDDMAPNRGGQFAGNFKKYAGHWSDLPVDAHMLIALNAPHPVFITGGVKDPWADPKGEFLSVVAAGPVYRLVGRKDLGASEFPPPDTPLITGDLGFHYHSEGHAITPSDWKAFFDFAGTHLKPVP